LLRDSCFSWVWYASAETNSFAAPVASVISTAQRQSAFRANLQTEDDRLLNVGEDLLSGLTLTHAARDGRALRDPGPILVSIYRYEKFHGCRALQLLGDVDVVPQVRQNAGYQTKLKSGRSTFR
jgi:hypothetical protein